MNPKTFPENSDQTEKLKKGEKRSYFVFACYFPKCPISPINHTCIMTMETGLSRLGWHIWLPNHETHIYLKILVGSFMDYYKGNAPSDLRPKGVSSRRHTDATQALYTTGRLAKLVLTICTRHQEETKNKKRQKQHSP